MTADMVWAGALLAMSAITLALLIQYFKLRDIVQMVRECRTSIRQACIGEMENRELRAALRAEKAHVEQLQRKLALIQSMIPEY